VAPFSWYRRLSCAERGEATSHPAIAVGSDLDAITAIDPIADFVSAVKSCHVRKTTIRDWAALGVPAFVLLMVGVIRASDDGWTVGITSFALPLVFVIWLWRRQIIKYPEDTWRPRL